MCFASYRTNLVSTFYVDPAVKHTECITEIEVIKTEVISPVPDILWKIERSSDP